MIICKYFSTPRGCLKGSACPFQHGNPQPTTPHEQPRQQQPRQQQPRQQQPRNTTAEYLAGVPCGLCKAFWETARCPQGVRCKHKHDRVKPGVALVHAPTRTSDPADFTRLSTPAPPDRQILRTLVTDEHFKFQRPNDVYPVVAALWASTKETALWTHGDGQAILADVAAVNGPAMARLGEILNWKLSTTASNTEKLSFQRGFLVLAFFLTARSIRNSPMTPYVNMLYACVNSSASTWAPEVEACLQLAVDSKSLVEPGVATARTRSSAPDSLFTKFPDTPANNPALLKLFRTLQIAFETYAADFVSAAPTFVDSSANQPLANRVVAIEVFKDRITTLDKILKPLQAAIFAPGPPRALCELRGPSKAVIEALRRLFVPPGALRDGGPRHDNDHANISIIKIIPSHDKLLCPIAPFVPANLHEAPHHLPPGMARQLDVLFRLLREDFLSPVRSAVTSLMQDLEDHSSKQATNLSRLLKRGGGRYHADDQKNAVDLNVYTNVAVQKLAISPSRHELVLHLEFKTPSGFGVGPGAIRKRLTRGSLVGLLSQAGTGSLGQIFLGVVSEEPKTTKDKDREVLVISFFDSAVYLQAIRQLSAQHASNTQSQSTIFFEVQGFLLDTLRPFLESLQRLEPSVIPFAKYLSAVPGPTAPTTIDPPLFTRLHGFRYDLTPLICDGERAGQLFLDVLDADSTTDARTVLSNSSRLDPSQAEAMVDCLTREVAIVEGPPGTGKSWLGVELIRVLLHNQVGLILILAYTNHALDTLLKSIIDNNVTRDIIRGGSGSKDELMSTFTLQNILKARPVDRDPILRREIAQQVKSRKTVEDEIGIIASVASLVNEQQLEFPQVAIFLDTKYPHHHDTFDALPAETADAALRVKDDGWMMAGRHRQQFAFTIPKQAVDVFRWWRDGRDHALMLQLRREYEMEVAAQYEVAAPEVSSNPFDILRVDEGRDESDGEDDYLPHWRQNFDVVDSASEASDASIDELFPEYSWTPPATDRPISEILEIDNIWTLSMLERDRLMRHWADELVNEQAPQLDRLRERLASINAHIKTIGDQGKLELIRNAKIIGCTTNSAANILEIIKSAGPTVIMVEEAGECLEAQVVANLVPSVQHLIMIGDHKQLRPHVTCHHLSVDSSQGQIHRHDVSLFERLALLPLPMSILKTQRRMRPTISSLIKNFLYPELEDAPQVLNYPKVRGMAEDVFFIDHQFPEDRQASGHSSKLNKKEAHWVVDLVRHLLKQGYRANDIAVLTPYLGQLSEIRRLLAAESIVVHLDERDLADMESESEDAPAVEGILAQRKSLDSQVILRTVDNFQGEEAKIVVLSLVRSDAAGVDSDTGAVILDRDSTASIGFLKSPNRTNVALSRAKHGLFIFGAAHLFSARSPMWKSVIDELRGLNLVGPTLPAICDQHPDEIHDIDSPGVLPCRAPEGGCFQQCEFQLACGHRCAQKCHPQDRKHEHIQCPQKCRKLLGCGHPCQNLCGESHGPCRVNINSVELPCGHTKKNVKCSQLADIERIACTERVDKSLPCGHTESLPCPTDARTFRCYQRCGGRLNCSHKHCVAPCGDCARLRAPAGTQRHAEHKCDRPLQCGHACTGSCESHASDGCDGTCREICRRACSHGACKHPCAERCPGCPERCQWICPHGSCQVPCDMPCSRLPCDLPCIEALKCGHRCPSICGEACTHQLCPTCASDKTQTIDFILMSTLADFDVASEDPSERLITLGCGHAFTVETLDGLFDLASFYRRGTQDAAGRWIGLAHPESANDVPPQCLLCRAPISHRFAQRYGRSLKHAELNARERNTMVRGTAALAVVTDAVSRLDLEGIKAKLKKFTRVISTKPSSLQDAANFQRAILKDQNSSVFPPSAFLDLRKHAASPAIQKAWRIAVLPIINVYEHAANLFVNSPHRIAYEGAVAALFNDELRRLTESGERARDPEKSALEFAKSSVGAPPPKADERCSVEAIWITLDLRLSLVDAARALLASLVDRKDSGDPATRSNAEALRLLAFFVLRTCHKDVLNSLNIAKTCGAERQALQAHIRLLRIKLELSRVETHFCIETNLLSRSDAAAAAEVAREKSLKSFDIGLAAFREMYPDNRAFVETSEAWIKSNINPARKRIEEQWADVIRFASSDTFYQPVTRDEREEIVRTMGFAATGHWYACPNGHTFTIGECGGAMQQASCPECGRAIGGSDHSLLRDNSKDETMEAIAVAGGARRNGFPWG